MREIGKTLLIEKNKRNYQIEKLFLKNTLILKQKYVKLANLILKGYIYFNGISDGMGEDLKILLDYFNIRYVWLRITHNDIRINGRICRKEIAKHIKQRNKKVE